MRKALLASYFWLLIIVVAFIAVTGWAQSKDLPDRPNPPALVNDLAGMLTPGQRAQLEEKLDEFDRQTSTQVVVVTITSLGSYDEADYAIKLGKKWAVGQAGKNNGVVILAAKNEHKLFVAVGTLKKEF